jgi:hypothetical protein
MIRRHKKSSIECVGWVLSIDRIAVEMADDSIFVLRTEMQLTEMQVAEIRRLWDEQWKGWGLKPPRTIICTWGLHLSELSDLELELYGLKRIAGLA